MNLTSQPPSPSSSRSKFWDLMRGIGILSIVIGHSCAAAVQYVYAYHLAVFFFVSGFLYNEKKYGLNPFGHVAAKLKSAWPKYMIYMSIFILMRNPFQKIGINAPGNLYNRSYTLASLANSILFQGMEPMGGALWFVPFWILSCSIFGGTVWFSLHFFQNQKPAVSESTPYSPWIQAAPSALAAGISVLFGISGAVFIFRQLFLSYQLHLAFLVQPILAAGWLIRCHLPSYRKLVTWYLALPCAVLLVFITKKGQVYIDLSSGRIGNGWQYFLLAFLGIYCCLYLASLLERISPVSQLVSLWGRYSFDVMGLHFLVFKIIDLTYGRLILSDPIESYSAFPIAYSMTLWPLYAILGTTIPALIGYLADNVQKRGFTP